MDKNLDKELGQILSRVFLLQSHLSKFPRRTWTRNLDNCWLPCDYLHGPRLATWLRSLRLSQCAMAALLFSDTVCLTCPSPCRQSCAGRRIALRQSCAGRRIALERNEPLPLDQPHSSQATSTWTILCSPARTPTLAPAAHASASRGRLPHSRRGHGRGRAPCAEVPRVRRRPARWSATGRGRPPSRTVCAALQTARRRQRTS